MHQFSSIMAAFIFLQGKHHTQEYDDKSERAADKTPGKKQNQETFETEEVQLLSPMVFAQPVNGHRSTNMNNDGSVLETSYGEITPLTKSQLSQVYQNCIQI